MPRGFAGQGFPDLLRRRLPVTSAGVARPVYAITGQSWCTRKNYIVKKEIRIRDHGKYRPGNISEFLLIRPDGTSRAGRFPGKEDFLTHAMCEASFFLEDTEESTLPAGGNRAVFSFFTGMLHDAARRFS